MSLARKSILRLLLYFGYGLLGSWLFCLIEGQEESYSTTGKRLLENLKMKMIKKYNLTNSTDFDEFVAEAIEAKRVSTQYDWTFLSGCGFSFAVLLTIGYGDMVPKTTFGKAFLIPYCLVGLPIAMLALKTAGEAFHLAIKHATVSLEKKMFGNELYPEKKLLKCFTVIWVLLVLIICMVAGLEIVFENWSFLDGVYCWFVTLTTIGLGDYVPFQYYREENRYHDTWRVYLAGILFGFPLIIGLCLVSAFLNVLVQGSEEIKIHFCACFGQPERVSQSEQDARDLDNNRNGRSLQEYGMSSRKKEDKF